MIYYSHGTIELLGEDKANHFMGKCHFRERHFLIGTSIDIIGETVRATDNEYQPTRHRCHLLLNVARELHRRELTSVLIEKNHIIGAIERCKDIDTFLLLLLLFAKTFGVLGIAYILDIE